MWEPAVGCWQPSGLGIPSTIGSEFESSVEKWTQFSSFDWSWYKYLAGNGDYVGRYLFGRIYFQIPWHQFFALLPVLYFFFFNAALRPQRPYGLLGTGREAQGGHLDFHTALELWVSKLLLQCRFTSTETVRTISDGKPRTFISSFTDTAPVFWLYSSLWGR